MTGFPLFDVGLAAALFGLGAPLAKLLLRRIDPLVLAGLLYIGAFLGLTALRLVRFAAGRKRPSGPKFSSRDLLPLAGSIAAGGVLGPIALLYGLTLVSGFTASLLLNLEAVMTALLAVLFFREQAGIRTWGALFLMVSAGVFLGMDGKAGAFSWTGAAFILAAMAGWGLDNNLTRMIADKDPQKIAVLKGLFAGFFSLGLAAVLGRPYPGAAAVSEALLIGMFCYGFSLVLYIRALAGLGAFRAGVFFGLAPFAGAAASLALFRDALRWPMAAATVLMLAGTAALARERHAHRHRHLPLVHFHVHHHDDGHHAHPHGEAVSGRHTHEHAHEETAHSHVHWPDLHHRHRH